MIDKDRLWKIGKLALAAEKLAYGRQQPEIFQLVEAINFLANKKDSFLEDNAVSLNLALSEADKYIKFG